MTGSDRLLHREQEKEEERKEGRREHDRSDRRQDLCAWRLGAGLFITPLYRQRNNGQEFIRHNAQGEIIKRADNRWVVPYNPYLCWRYKAHINVEICASIRAIKYIHKYIYKGSDRITMEVQNKDEIQCHLQARYIGPCKAMWRLLGYKIHQEKPPVQRLHIHLPGMLSNYIFYILY